MAQAAAVEGTHSLAPGPGAGEVRSLTWQALAGSDAVVIDLPRATGAQSELLDRVQALPAGIPIVLSSRGLGSRHRIRRFAERTGMRLRREFLAVPSLVPPTCYVEVAPRSVHYFLSRVLTLPRGGFAASVLVEAAKAAGRFGFPRALFAALLPAQVALAQRGGLPDPGDRTDGDVGLLSADGKQAVILALSKDPNAKLTLLFIPGTDKDPSLAVKVPTTASAAAAVASERRVLATLAGILPEEVLSTLPKLSQLNNEQADAVLVTTALRGTPMTGRYHAWRHLASKPAVEDDFDMAERWLAAFQGTSTGEPKPIEIDGGADELLAARFGPKHGFAPTMERVREIRGRLRAERTPATPVHGDFWFGNLLCTGHRITGVVDWEAGAIAGEPLRDLVRFALSYALYMDRHTRPGRSVAGHRGLTAGAWGAGIEYAIDGRGWFPDLFCRFLRNGLVRLGADPECWRDASLAGLIDVAASADHLEFARQHWRLFARLSA